MSTISSTTGVTATGTPLSTATTSTTTSGTGALLADATVLRQTSIRLSEIQVQLSRSGSSLASSLDELEEEPSDENRQAVVQAITAAQQVLTDAAAALELPPPVAEVRQEALPPEQPPSTTPPPRPPAPLAQAVGLAGNPLAGIPAQAGIGVPGLAGQFAATATPVPGSQALLTQAWSALTRLLETLVPATPASALPVVAPAAPAPAPVPTSLPALLAAQARQQAQEEEALAAAAAEAAIATGLPLAAAVAAGTARPASSMPPASPFVNNPMVGASLTGVGLGADPRGIPGSAMSYAMAAMAAMNALGTRAAEPASKGRDKAERARDDSRADGADGADGARESAGGTDPRVAVQGRGKPGGGSGGAA